MPCIGSSLIVYAYVSDVSGNVIGLWETFG
jgi:hypothetical protein